MKFENRLALIDIGSNTIRLVIFSYDRYFNLSELQNIKLPSRLASYIKKNGDMSQEGIRLLQDVLVNFNTIIERFDVQDTFFVATAAIRNSKNVEDIKESVKKHTGIQMQVLNEDEEAFYGNYAVRHTMNIKKGISIDIGGGSTELVLFTKDERLETVSLPFGAVTLKESFFKDKDHNDPKAIKKACRYIKKQVSQLDWLVDSQLPLVGIGGSVRNIGEVHQRANNYPIAGIHGYRMSEVDFEETLDILCSRSMEELADLDGLSKERTDTIVSANLVFQQILQVSNSDHLFISSRGLREGYIMKYLNDNHNHPYSLHNIRAQSIVRIARKYKASSYAVNQRVIIADQLVQELERNDILSLSDWDLEMLYWGCMLYYLGSYIESNGWSQHTFYIISNIAMAGFNQKERVAIALIASFKNKSLYSQYMEEFSSWFTSKEQERLLYMGGIVKFSEALNDAQVNVIEKLKLEQDSNKYYRLVVDYKGELIAEEYRANKQKNHIERFLDGDLDIVFVDNVKK